MDKLLIIADDFTGALDTGIQFTKMGVRAKIITDYQYDFQNLKEQVCDDISENARNDNADYCDSHNTTSLFTYTHADCRGNGLRKEGNIVDVFYAKQRTQEKNAACAGCHTRGNGNDHRKEILF